MTAVAVAAVTLVEVNQGSRVGDGDIKIVDFESGADTQVETLRYGEILLAVICDRRQAAGQR